MKLLVGRALKFIKTELQACLLRGLPASMADHVRTEQVNSLSVVVIVMSITGIGTVLLTIYEYWSANLRTILVFGAAFIIVCYSLLFRMSLVWMSRHSAEAGAAGLALRRFVPVSIALGLAWGGLLVVLMSHSDPGERSLLYGIIIGLMSAPAMVTPCSAAFAFWVPIVAGGAVSIGLVSSARDLGGAMLLTGYTSLSLFCLVYLNRALIKRVVAEVQQSEGRETINLLLRDFEESACDWLWETDLRGNLTHVSPRFAVAFGCDVADLLGKNFLQHLARHSDRSAAATLVGPANHDELSSLILCRLPFRDIEERMRIKGENVCWSLTGKPKFADGDRFDGYRGVGSDITSRKTAVDRAAFLASFDDLTGLGNRRLFQETLSRNLASQSEDDIALMCLDLDGFKTVNDRYGHPVGDLLLKMVASRLRAEVGDPHLCARLGGDEYAVILHGLRPDLLQSLAQRLVGELSRPYVTDSHYLNVGVSIGLAGANGCSGDGEELQRRADAALYQAKSDGRRTWCLYDDALNDRLLRRRQLQTELQVAVSTGCLKLAFQPILEIGSGDLAAVEALVRWTRLDGEVVSPTEFIPLAESCGLITEMGAWILSAACKEAASLSTAVKLAVNISPMQLRDGLLVDQIAEVLHRSGLDPERLELEITETAFLDMNQCTLDQLDEIRALGIGINLDDFGVGQTSLSQLRRYPFSTLKIDQSFIRDMPTSKASRAIVRGLASMAKELGIKTTAEGIETEEQLGLVKDLGCEYVQGFLLGQPTSLERLSTAFQPVDALVTT